MIKTIVKLVPLTLYWQIRSVAHTICNLRFSITKEISVVFHNVFNFDYHFTIKEFGKEFEGEFNFLEENTEKCKTHSVSITREVKRADKNGNEITKRHLTSYNLLIVHHSWQAPYQMLLIILLRRLTKLNVIVDMII